MFELTQNVLDEVKRRKVDLLEHLKFEKVSDVNSVKLKGGVMSSVPLSFFSVGGKGMVSVFIVSLPSVGVGVEAMRLVEPVVEEAKVNKQLLADANKLMTDARIKGMKAVASLAGHTSSVLSVAFSPDGQHIVSASGCGMRLAGRRLRRWLGTRIVLFRSPSVLMGNILFRKVLTTW